MSLTTRCPACGTMFKVVPDQLRISEGWVRCGQCGEVFDAASSLHNDQPGPLQADAQGAIDSVPPSIADGTGEVDTLPSVLEEEPAQPQPTASTRPLLLDDAIAADLTFVQQSERKAFWQRPLVRGMLVLLVALLAALVVLQVAVQERDRLAATHPDLQPWLEKICRPIGCKPGPVRQIESIVIDSSTFNKLRGDTYRLSFTLKNQATTPVALPALELTLTDSQDQPVLRRVLTPAELGVDKPSIAAASDWSGSFALAVAGNGSPARIAGYRLLAFYP